jgi:uncharacterized MAPEG superfamily protein
MLTDIQSLLWSAILTFVMLCTASALRNRGWTAGGMQRAMGNREHVPEQSPLAGRADRAAKNMLENMVLFTALVAAAHFAGRAGTRSDLGATIFFWARLAFFLVYLAGIVYLRTAVWIISIVGLAIIGSAVWS